MAVRGRIALVLVLAVSACSSPGSAPPVDPDAIVIAAFDFPESHLLAEIYGQAIEDAGMPVHRELGLGTREFVQPALQRGLVDLVPEYSGSALSFVTLNVVKPSADEEHTHAALVHALEGLAITVLDAAPAQDRNGLAVTAATAAELELDIVSDLRPFAPTMTLGGPPECADRPLCLPGYERVYGLRFEAFLPVVASGSAALRAQVVDAAIVFTSDGVAERDGVVILEDDRKLQPAENVTPVVRTEVLSRYGPALSDLINAVSAALTTEELRAMNAEMAVDARQPAAVAADWLRREGFAE